MDEPYPKAAPVSREPLKQRYLDDLRNAGVPEWPANDRRLDVVAVESDWLRILRSSERKSRR
jgi:hypothetical protein